jgi:hypothetical protein
MRLIDYGVPSSRITVAADMAWLLDPASSEFGGALLQKLGVDQSKKLIGVNAMAETAALEKEPKLFAMLAAALDAVIDREDANVIFLANEIRTEPTFDDAAHRQILGQMKRAPSSRRPGSKSPGLRIPPPGKWKKRTAQSW